MNNNDITVSVVMLTYNHEKYIRKALDGIIMQKTSFRYEVIVCDDCSTDETQEVLKEYQWRYPDIFQLVLREENIGVSKNNYDSKHRAKGKYFACIEGDDYWTDENKLQCQVDFLENNPEYIACVHKCLFVNEDGKPLENQPVNGYYFNGEVFTVKDFERGFLPGQTATLMYRNIYLNKQLDYSILYKASLTISDKTAILLLLNQGQIYCMDKVMSCYRYIIDSNGTNASSKFIGKNNRDELMLYLNNLEKYAKEDLGMQLDMSYKKKQYFAAAVTVWLKDKTAENKHVMDRMIVLSGHKMFYHFFKCKIILTKLVGWKIFKKDIRIHVK